MTFASNIIEHYQIIGERKGEARGKAEGKLELLDILLQRGAVSQEVHSSISAEIHQKLEELNSKQAQKPQDS